MPHKPQNNQSLKKAFDHHRNNDHPAYRHKKTTSFYPFGHKKGAEQIATEAYRDGWDRIFANKKDVVIDLGTEWSDSIWKGGEQSPNHFNCVVCGNASPHNLYDGHNNIRPVCYRHCHCHGDNEFGVKAWDFWKGGDSHGKGKEEKEGEKGLLEQRADRVARHNEQRDTSYIDDPEDFDQDSAPKRKGKRK